MGTGNASVSRPGGSQGTAGWWEGSRAEMAVGGVGGQGTGHTAKKGQLERSAGSRGNRGPGISGHPGTSPGVVLKVGVRWRSRASYFIGRGVGPHGKCTRDSEGHAESHPVWALCPGPRHTLAGRLQDGSLEALPRGSVIKRVTWRAGRQPGRGAFRWPPRLLPAPQDPATALGKQLRKSSGNKNPIPSPSHSLGPDLPHPSAPRRGPSHRGMPAQNGWPWQGPVGMIVDPGLPAAGPVTPSGPAEPAPLPAPRTGHFPA